MPLEKGSGKAVIGRNIRTMMNHGHPQDQAVAAAINQAGGYEKSSKRKGHKIGKGIFKKGLPKSKRKTKEAKLAKSIIDGECFMLTNDDFSAHELDVLPLRKDAGPTPAEFTAPQGQATSTADRRGDGDDKFANTRRESLEGGLKRINERMRQRYPRRKADGEVL